MYRLASTNAWYNGMTFPSLAEAVAKQRKAEAAGCTCDVMRDEDNKSTKVVKCDAQVHCTRLMK